MIEDSTFRLIKADYTAPRKASANEDFSTAYTYDAVGNPLTVRRYGVVDIDATGRETFGLLDNLSYTYSGGNQVASIEQDSEGIDFYGRTGYSLTSGEYRWGASGNLTGDSSRGMTFSYNFQGQPTQVNFVKTSQQQLNTFSASGLLLSSNTIVLKQARPISSTTRHYSADRIFENGKLLYSYFPGGYFDAEGVPHFTHTDYQGSIIAVTDSAGHVVQHTAYYPYGEPHREPSGQPYLHGGKERLAPSADYDYGPRRYHSSALLWHKPDSKAGDYTHISPYVFCAANPILFTDPTGNDIYYFQKDGTLVDIKEDLDMDQIIVKSEEGDESKDSKSEELAYGTILKTTTVALENGLSADILTIRGDSNGDVAFEFLADNTNVEFTLIKCGEIGDKGLNFLSTSHEHEKERSGAQLIKKQLKYGYTVRAHYHSHPYNFAISDTDAEMVRDMETIFPNNSIQYYLYKKENGFGKYDRNTKPRELLFSTE